MLQPFSELSPDSRIWIFGLSRALGTDEEQSVSQALANFIEQWTAHQEPVFGSFVIREGRFLVVAADTSGRGANVSGCSIDAMFRAVSEVIQQLSLTLLDESAVFFRRNGEITAATRDEFQQIVESRSVNNDTPVFDCAISSLSAFDQNFEKPFSRSWHRQAFTLPSM